MVKLTRVYQESRLWYILLQLLTNKKVPFSDGRGWHIDESAHLPPLRPGYDSRTQCHLSFLSAWVCYWFSSLPREFLPESFSFSSSSKINTLNSNSTWKQWTGRATAWNVHCYNYIIIVIIIIIKFGPKIDLKWELDKGNNKSNTMPRLNEVYFEFEQKEIFIRFEVVDLDRFSINFKFIFLLRACDNTLKLTFFFLFSGEENIGWIAIGKIWSHITLNDIRKTMTIMKL